MEDKRKKINWLNIMLSVIIYCVRVCMYERIYGYIFKNKCKSHFSFSKQKKSDKNIKESSNIIVFIINLDKILINEIDFNN